MELRPCARCVKNPARIRTGTRGPRPIYCNICSREIKQEHMRGWKERGRQTRRTINCIICDASVPADRSASAKTCSDSCAKTRKDRYRTRWYAANRSHCLAAERVRKYGITSEQYQELLASQGYGCAICGTSAVVTFAVDHDHETGAVRGLLCQPCNSAIGLLADSPAVAERAFEYLSKWNEIRIKALRNGST